MAGKRHTNVEIATKLRQADEMAAKGMTQQEIARLLGVSIMTYHRWKKHPVNQSPSSQPDPQEARQSDDLAELEVENERLRRLVTDLLLEKMALQEQLGANNGLRRHRS